MIIKRYSSNVSIYQLRTILSGYIDTSTISLDRNITLTPRAVENLRKVYNQPAKGATTNRNGIEALDEGKKLLNQLFLNSVDRCTKKYGEALKNLADK